MSVFSRTPDTNPGFNPTEQSLEVGQAISALTDHIHTSQAWLNEATRNHAETLNSHFAQVTQVLGLTSTHDLFTGMLSQIDRELGSVEGFNADWNGRTSVSADAATVAIARDIMYRTHIAILNEDATHHRRRQDHGYKYGEGSRDLGNTGIIEFSVGNHKVSYFRPQNPYDNPNRVTAEYK